MLVRLMSAVVAFGIAASADALNIVPTFDSSIVNATNGLKIFIQNIQPLKAKIVLLTVFFYLLFFKNYFLFL